MQKKTKKKLITPVEFKLVEAASPSEIWLKDDTKESGRLDLKSF